MRDPDETIADIDDALDGYVTWNGHSDDAAHWSADRAERGDELLRRVESLMPSPLTQWQRDQILRAGQGRAFCAPQGTPVHTDPELGEPWRELGTVAGDGLMFGPPMLEARGYSPLRDEITVAITADVSRFVHAMEQMGKAVAAVGKQLTRVVDRQHVVLAALVYKDDLRAHRRSCRTCNPHGNPKPLAVNGAEYHRRRKARTRRNRR